MSGFSPEQMNNQEAEMASIFELPVDVAPAAPSAPAEAEAQPGAEVVAPSSAPAPIEGQGDGPQVLDPAPAQAAPDPAPVAPVAPAAPATPAPAAAPAAPAAPAPVVLTQEQFDALVAKANLAAPAAAPTPAQPPEVAQPETVVPVSYQELVLPEQLTQAIFSDDAGQATQAMNVLVQGLASTIHTRVQEQFRTEMKTTLEARDQRRQQETAQQEEQSNAAKMQQEFYTEFPALNNPVAKQIVIEAARELAREQPTAQWDQNYRAAMAARAQQKIAALAGIVAPVTAQPAPVAPAKPAAFVSPGSRQEGQNAAGMSTEDFIEDIMGGGGFDN